ncbi:hypothetical protein [Thermocatellispora tengchongensis]|uniref:hypothetical protein n=1 Tax=Thermocatellispora tengchongensis TaxID=1073253 RepID=UPI0036269218
MVETAATPMDACWYASTLVRTRRSGAAGSLLDFLTTPPATQVMLSPAAGVPRARFRPTVRVSIWD